MKVVNPLFRKQNNADTSAHACNCVCSITQGNHDSTHNDSWWFWNSSCGCGCDGTSANKNANHDKAVNM
ncbi:hypothetical protein [Paenibacillus sp. J22TS3]|uniref:hypothetical protein n=1 Tax=Paenibacillus sp. J22TS3 TaxID=2807192 RepID=UPI001B2E07EE|nr:hypothetical protein [Paenibacillus sp. J22TS3]GIP21124.1 hypothetical protein J22TS3_13990 [Paenibacillus sp. J22TS3]